MTYIVYLCWLIQRSGFCMLESGVQVDISQRSRASASGAAFRPRYARAGSAQDKLLSYSHVAVSSTPPCLCDTEHGQRASLALLDGTRSEIHLRLTRT